MALHRYRNALAALAIASTATVAAAGTAGAAVYNPSHARVSTATKLVFRKNGTPILTGMTIHIANSAGSAYIGDAHIYVMEQALKQWGATTSMVNDSANIAELGVASGNEDICTSPVATAISLGLTAFGPNQTSIAYFLMVPTSIRKLSQLKGLSYADDYSAGNVDFPLWAAAAKLGGFKMSDMNLVTTGAEANSYIQVIDGKVSAAWVDPSMVARAGPGFHTLATGEKVAPKYAESMMFATPSWLAVHPATAEAIDLAWLASAETFNTDEGAWAAAAYSYTAGTNTIATLRTAYKLLKSIGGFAVSHNSFSRQAVAENVTISKGLGFVSTLGNRPLAQLVKTAPWDAAWAQFNVHMKAY
ncbi:MAG TPA: hypothetical protein VMU99_08740 [Acidimicrobiales bacterium]|nr:hypothetical protein [Acidimicrobiales bacterium]